MKKLLLTDITADLVGAYIVGWLKQCHCGVLFIGAKDALFCSDKCRKRK